MTQKELAKKLGIRDSTISQWENGINSIDNDTLIDICRIFNVSVSEMYGKYANTSGGYSFEEKDIIHSFRSLNQAGKTHVLKQITFALLQDEYKKDYNVQKNCLA